MTKEWLKKTEAAEILGMSERSVLVMAQMGQIESKVERDPETKQLTKMLHAGDVERVKYQRENPQTVQSAQSEPSQALQTPQALKRQDLAALELLKGVMGSIRPPAPVIKPWLTIEDAAEYSGLPAGCLVHLIQDGKLAALDVGVRKGGRWRISRRDLDGLQGVLVQAQQTMRSVA